MTVHQLKSTWSEMFYGPEPEVPDRSPFVCLLFNVCSMAHQHEKLSWFGTVAICRLFNLYKLITASGFWQLLQLYGIVPSGTMGYARQNSKIRVMLRVKRQFFLINADSKLRSGAM